MTARTVRDPELEEVFAAGVHRGDFSSVEDARTDFHVKLDESLAQANRGELFDLDIVMEQLRERHADWPRAAE